MNPEQAKSLTPRHVRQELEPDRVPWEDIAGKLARMPEWAADYCRLKYANDQVSRHAVRYHLFEFIKGRARKENWPLGTLYLLIDLAIDESLVAGPCGYCGGSGQAFVKGVKGECGACEGSGRTRYTTKYRACRTEVDRTTWGRTWRHRYAQILDRLGQAESEIGRVR